MKKLFLSLIMLSMTAFATAADEPEAGDWAVKIQAGIAFSNLTNSPDGKWRTSLTVGPEFEYHLSEDFGLSAGVFYCQQGQKARDGYYTFTANLDYINVPIMLNYYIVNGLAIKAGIQPGFMVKQRIKANGMGADWDPDKDFDYDTQRNVFDFSIPVGLSYQIADFLIDARYHWGLTKTHRDANTRNSVFTITVGYSINSF